jgi:hypothetical protein
MRRAPCNARIELLVFLAMLPRPTIFISSVSGELRSARQLVANTLTFLGYEPVWQDIFGTEATCAGRCAGSTSARGPPVDSAAAPATRDGRAPAAANTQYERPRPKARKASEPVLDERFPPIRTAGARGAPAAAGLHATPEGRH